MRCSWGLVESAKMGFLAWFRWLVWRAIHWLEWVAQATTVCWCLFSYDAWECGGYSTGVTRVRNSFFGFWWFFFIMQEKVALAIRDAKTSLFRAL